MASEGMQQLMAMFASQEPPAEPPTIAQMRANMEQMMGQFPLETGTKVLPFAAEGIHGEWVISPNSRDDRVILYLHGGGYVMGSPRTHRSMVSKLAADAEACVLALNYRKAPEHPYPAALEDAVTAYRWLLENGWDAGQLAVSGDSAGGGLTVSLLLALKDQGLPQPRCAVPISPWVDHTGNSETYQTRMDQDPMVQKDGILTMSRHYLGETGAADDPAVSPVFADLSGIAPLYIMVGDFETLLGDAQALHEKAVSAGVDSDLDVWDEMIHVWHVFHAMVPEGRAAIEKMGDYIKNRWD